MVASLPEKLAASFAMSKMSYHKELQIIKVASVY